MLFSEKQRNTKLLFFLIVLLTMLPLILFVLRSVYYHRLYQQPVVQAGRIDLADETFQRPVPLDGAWEYFPDRWIISSKAADEQGGLVSVPQWKTSHFFSRHAFPSTQAGSYRLTLENCPNGLRLVCYIPNINARYRVFLNGELITQHGDLGVDPALPMQEINQLDDHAKRGLPVFGGNAEVVIELYSSRAEGLYMTPVLAEYGSDHFLCDLRNLLAAALIGVLIVSIGCIACFILLRDKTLPPVALLTLDIVALMRVISLNSFRFPMDGNPVLVDYISNTLLQIMVLFLPVAFLHFGRQMINLDITPRKMRHLLIYELAFCPLLLWCTLTGRPRLFFFLCCLSYLPFLPILRRIYRLIDRGEPHILFFSSILLLTISGMLASPLTRSGLLVTDVTLFPPAALALSIILQLWMYISHNVRLQRHAVEAENLRLRLAQSETALMLSQIKPHFLYNTLIAIQMLCMDSPETAADTVGKFAVFLRTNMNFISSHEPIPFERELRHIQNYADIEKLRFQKRLELRYEINTQDFTVPALSIQPLVENAIRHGACKSIGGGFVLLRTREEEHHFVIEVIDDGPGFDPALLTQEGDGAPHGIQNVVFRLREQMHAQVAFETASGQGTTVRVALPKEASE